LIIIASLSCKDTSNNVVDFNTKPESLNVLESNLNGFPLLSNKTNISKELGESTQIKPNCVVHSNLKTTNKNVTYSCWVFSKTSLFVFDVYKDLGYCSYVDFSQENNMVSTPRIDLNHKTTLEEIKRIFPKAYDLKVLNNQNNNVTISLIDNFSDEKKAFANLIELVFEKGLLKEFNYTIEPEYIEALNKGI